MATQQQSILLMHYGIEASAKREPDKTALIEGNKRLTFSELDKRSNQVANTLLSSGLQKGDRAVLDMLNCLEYPEIMYGCSKAGIVVVPISFLLAPPEVQYIVTNSEAKILFVSGLIVDVVRSIRSDIPLVKQVVVVGGGAGEEEDYEAWREGASTEKPGVAVDENDVFYIGYTSGTTGKPKGAVISHRSRLLAAFAGAIEYRINQDDVQLTVAPIYHAAPIAFLLMQLYVGGTVVILSGFAPEGILAAIDAHRVTNAFLVPTMLQGIALLPETVRSKFDTSSLRVVISAGAPLPTKTKEETLRFFPDLELHEFYGSTEAPLNITLRPRDQLRKIKCCGKPLVGWEVQLLDENKNPISQPDVVGEIFVRGGYMFNGYLNNPEATAASFHDGWFSAGDLGKMDEEGYFYVVDRIKDMIISGGVNIYPVEIEDCLMNHPALADVAVIGVPDEKWGEAVRAIVQLKPGQEASEEEIIDFCNNRIARYKKPKSIVFAPGIPKNASGKTLKVTLRELFGASSGGN